MIRLPLLSMKPGRPKLWLALAGGSVAFRPAEVGWWLVKPLLPSWWEGLHFELGSCPA
jgi:hypothetical protein